MADPTTTKDTQSVLDAMTKGVFELKGAKATTLTPRGMEKVGVPEVPEVFLTNEAIRDIAVDIRRQVETLLAVADGLDKLTQLRSATEAVPQVVEQAAKVEQKEREKAADEAAAERAAIKAVETEEAAKFAAEFAAKQEAAQAATFTQPDGEAVCPTHGVAKTRKLMGGKTVRMCTTCNWKEIS